MSGYVKDCQGDPTKRFSQMENRKDECVNPWASLVNVFDESKFLFNPVFLFVDQIIIQKRVCDSFSDSITCWWQMTAFYSKNWHTMGKRKEKELARICNELINQTCPWELRLYQMLFRSIHFTSLDLNCWKCVIDIQCALLTLIQDWRWHIIQSSLELTRICFRMNPQDYQIVRHGIGLCLHVSIKEASSASEFIANRQHCNRFPFFKSRWRWIHPSAETSSGVNEKIISPISVLIVSLNNNQIDYELCTCLLDSFVYLII